MTAPAPPPASEARVAPPPGRRRRRFLEEAGGPPPRTVRAASLAYALAAAGVLLAFARVVATEPRTPPGNDLDRIRGVLFTAVIAGYAGLLAWTIRGVRPKPDARGWFVVSFLIVFAHALVGAAGAAALAIAPRDRGPSEVFVMLAALGVLVGWAPMLALGLAARGWAAPFVATVFGVLGLLAAL